MIMYHYRKKWAGRIDWATSSSVAQINVEREKRECQKEGQIDEGGREWMNDKIT